MFKPSNRIRIRPFTSAHAHQVPGFAETQFLHAEDDEDYSGFAPTQMFEDEPRAPLTVVSRAAESSLGAAPPRADAPAEEGAMPTSWVTSRWVDVQEAKAHEAAHQARAVIAAQRRGDADVRPAPSATASDIAPATGWMRRFQRAVQRVLPIDFYSVLPLFICVSLTMALISAVLPMFDKP
jgi:hypothetical protein